jgi:hypothetical protein
VPLFLGLLGKRDEMCHVARAASPSPFSCSRSSAYWRTVSSMR